MEERGKDSGGGKGLEGGVVAGGEEIRLKHDCGASVFFLDLGGS
jgi:hypothetical protein